MKVLDEKNNKIRSRHGEEIIHHKRCETKWTDTYLQTVNYQTRVHNPLKRPAQFKKKLGKIPIRTKQCERAQITREKVLHFFPPIETITTKRLLAVKKPSG